MCLNYWGDELKKNKIDRHVAHMWERRSVYTILVGNMREKYHLEDVGTDGKIIMKWNFEEMEWGWSRFIWLRIGKSGGLL